MRLVERNCPGGQSFGHLRLKRRGGNFGRSYMRDIFHTLVDMKTGWLALLIVASYMVVATFYAVLFTAVGKLCIAESHSFIRSMFFSVETLITIGYGVRDPSFGGCWSAFVVISAEAMTSIILDAVALGLFFQRVARAQQRARTIIFSARAVVREIGGSCYLMFQVCDVRKRQLVEAHVRCYAVGTMYDEDGRAWPYQGRAMRLQRPNDELGAFLLLHLPNTVVHRIDAWSPLVPQAWREVPPPEPSAEPRVEASVDYRYPEILQRVADIEAGARDTHSPFTHVQVKSADVVSVMRKHRIEIVAIIEGIDAPTSATIQAMHSYTAEDTEVDAMFTRCVFEENGACVVDMDRFQETVSTISGPDMGVPSPRDDDDDDEPDSPSRPGRERRRPLLLHAASVERRRGHGVGPGCVAFQV